MSDANTTPITCPCCRAASAAGPTCRRCKADLSLVVAVADRRAAVVLEARRAAARGESPEALELLDEAAWLRAGDDVEKLRAVVSLLAGDFPTALAAYHGLTHRRATA